MDKKLTFRQCIHHLLRFLKPNRHKLLLGLALVVVCQVTYALMPSVEGGITSQIQLDLQAGRTINMSAILKILFTLLCIYLVKISAQFSSAFFLTDSIQKTMYDIREAIELKINHLPVSYFDRIQTGEVLSRITNDVDTLSNALQQTLSRILGAICTFVFVLFMMFRISATMTWMVIAGLPVIGFISLFIMKKSQPLFDAQQASYAALNATVNEMYAGCSEILAYNQVDYAKKVFEKDNQQMRRSGFRAQFASGLIGPLTSLITYLVIGLTALYACFQVLAGRMLIGDLQAFIRYIWNINDPIAQLSQLSSAIQSAFSAMNRLFTFLEIPNEEDQPSKVEIGEVESVDFRNVRFSYDSAELMKDVNLHIGRGQTVAVVGPTGAGKTTLTNLLLRFYDVKGGSIEINGVDIRDLSRHDLRSLFGLVLQDTWMTEDTVEENLKFGRQEARRDEIISAAKQAHIHHYIRTLSEGYQTVLNESATNISQGEKQLLTIARALVRDPQILILDEATSSVDTRLEKQLQSAMGAAMEKRTSFVIAHRLSTIVNADLILVMNHGDIVESGTHEELLAKNGMYASLYNSQFQDMEAEA